MQFGSVGTSSALLAAAENFSGSVTVRNTHASNRLYLSFNAAATLEDFSLAPNASVTFPALQKDLQGLGSGADTTYTLG